MKFRSQLLWAILAVVSLTTATSLWVSQKQNQQAFQTLVSQLFRTHTESFRSEQNEQLRQATAAAERLALSVRLFAALEEGDPLVYKIAADEMRLDRFAFFRLVDANGRLIEPPIDSRAGSLNLNTLQGDLLPAQGSTHDVAASSETPQVQLGYVGIRHSDQLLPYRLLAAPIANFGTTVGTLVLGQRIDEAAVVNKDGLVSSLLLDGHWLGGNISRDLAEIVLSNDETQLAEGEITDAAGTRYRVFRLLLNDGSAYAPAQWISLYSLAEHQAQQRRLLLGVTAAGLVTWVIAVFFAIGFARKLTEPLNKLVAATTRIRQGDFAVQVPPRGAYELISLAEAFNVMTKDLALKERYHAVLHQVADAQVAEALISGAIKLGGELREVTVLFCDIRGYTPLTVARPAQEVIELLNQHMGAMTSIVQAHRGVINQFAGDAIMALFGAPKAYGDDTERAASCAIAMVLAREQLNQNSASPIDIGIGIATGQMVAGCIGAESRADYTVVGERVNLAARLTGAAPAGQIYIDDATYARVRDQLHCEPLAPLALKGFNQPVNAYQVLH